MRALLLILLLAMCACTKKNAADIALDDVRRFTAEGKYEQALEKHIWFHNHALEVDEAYRGVRLSFALADWVDLGRKYPKALMALKGIRDEKAARLLKGEANRELFNDVASINDYLKESGATINLFKKLDDSKPEFAASVFDDAEEALVAAGEYDLAKKYLVNPMERFVCARESFHDGMKYAKISVAAEASRKAFESIFAEEIVRIITILDKTGDSGQAREIQSKALAVLDSSAIRAAIKP